MNMRWQERLPYLFLAALVAILPFEISSYPVMSSLQWLFVATAAISIPMLIHRRKVLLRDRLVLTALLFVLTQWIAAALAPEFAGNALKAALRVTAGLVLLCISICLPGRRSIIRIWSVAAVLAAGYGILDYVGFGANSLFRNTDFYFGSAVRLSGSFEYPNTAAAFYAMSLPIVWTAPIPRWFRIGGSLLMWAALLLTYSRGAAIAVLVAFAVWALVKGRAAAPAFILSLSGVLLMLLSPRLAERFRVEPPTKAFAAEYEPEFTKMVLQPGVMTTMALRIRNAGAEVWAKDKADRLLLAYRWYDPERHKLILEANQGLSIAGPFAPQQSVAVTAAFTTPSDPGLYLLTWDIFHPEARWLSSHGVYPGLVEVEVRENTVPSHGQTDLSRWYRRDVSSLFVANVPFSRIELWSAALAMARAHPLVGVGPDNFRLLHGRHFGVTRWNTNIRSNSLYLELVSGSGLVGLVAFCVMLTAVRWNFGPASIALAIFLIHGLVDVFLMTTPIYFAFWILLGQAGRDVSSSNSDIS